MLYDGTTFAETYGAVLVTINYRLGAFGFLAHPALREEGEGSGNYGMLDQIAALDWTQRNIAAFGGDPNRIVAFGESAGSVSVCRLLATPRTEGMLAGAIMQSGGCGALSQEVAEETGLGIAAALACEGEDVAGCLREKATAEIMGSFESTIDIAAAGASTFGGVIDGDIVPDVPRNTIAAGGGHDVPVILGSNAQETGSAISSIPTAEAYEVAVRGWVAAGGLPPGLADLILAAYPVEAYASPRAAFIAMTTDARFTCPNRNDATILADAFASPVYRYHFAQVPENGGVTSAALGAFHGLELFFLFNKVDAFFPLGDSDINTSVAMGEAWTALPAGQPLGQGWPTWGPAGEVALIQDGVAAVADPRTDACDFWDSLLP